MKALKTFMITLLVVLVAGCFFIAVRSAVLKKQSQADVPGVKSSETEAAEASSKKSKANPVTKAIISTTIDSYIENSSDEKVKEIADSMSEEDKDAVTEIIANNISIDSLPEVQSAISDGDTGDMLEYAEENLSEEEMAQLKEIMSKYVTP